MARKKPSTAHGLVLIDKPAGLTSHDVVYKLRGHFGEKRIGHAGTLDPDATGLLVVGVGNATRLFRYMADMDKTYSCEIVFGVETDSLDDSGAITATHEMTPPNLEDVRRIISAQFLGEIMQVPPMVSALRVDGVRLHKLAREGIEVERPARPITVYSFEVEATDNPMVIRATVRSGAGTYIRSLGADLGTALGGGAHIRTLRRFSVGPFSVDEASTIAEPTLLPIREAVRHLAVQVLDDSEVTDCRFGRTRIAWDGDGPWAAVDSTGELVGVFEVWLERIAKPTVVFQAR
jgi:tRNA pseudouridine55 synthase